MRTTAGVADPHALYATLRDRTQEAIRSVFPIIGQKRTMELESFRESAGMDSRDVGAQLRAKLDDETWGGALQAKVVLRDNVTGKVMEKRDVPLAVLPHMTSTKGYIVDGKEYYVDYLWRTKPGVYISPKARGMVASLTGTGKRQEIILRPEQKQFVLQVGTSTMPLAPVLGALGVSPSRLKSAWGKEVYAANRLTDTRSRTAVDKFQKALGAAGQNPIELREALSRTHFDPQVNERTLSKAYEQLDPDVLMDTSSKMLAISRGKAEADDRDSIRFKELIGLDDQLGEVMTSFAQRRARSLRNAVDRHDKLENILRPMSFHGPVRGFFGRSALAQLSDQTSPVEMSRAATRTTIAGEGMNLQALETGQAKGVNPSHISFIDPVDTPEGSRAGVNLQLASGVVKDGKTPKTLLYNTRTKDYEYVNPSVFEDSVVAMPDQYRKKGKVWTPVGKQIRVSSQGNKFSSVAPSKVDYIIPNPNLLFGMGSILVPFSQNTPPGRMEMSSRHLSQALSLVGREAPLVQVTASAGDDLSMEEMMGKEIVPLSPVDGEVVKVEDGAVHVKSRGKVHRVSLYENYPLMGKREMLNETPVVKKGDKVKKGQPLADSNFTQNGVLALGRNLTTGLIHIPGLAFEDAMVVSEQGARKLTSEHLHKMQASPDDQEFASPKRFQAYYPTAYTKDQLAHIGDDGIVKPGTELKPGDPIMLGLREQTFTNEAQAMKKMHRSLARPYTDQSRDWDADYTGKVVRVHKTPKGEVKVHIRTTEPLQISDKISSRYGVKGVVVSILPDDEMPRTKDGKILDLAMSPNSVAGRMAAGQMLEIASGKIAERRGTPVKVPNFLPDTDYAEMTREAMSQLGIPDQEEIVDPKTGKVLGRAMVGPTYIVKQKHQADRKMTARASGPGFSYDVNRQPKGGSQGGGQTLGGLGNLALLAHGARNILQEAHSLKVDADQADETWRAIQLGQPVPPPRLTFAHKKFEGYLKTMGVKLEKSGTRLRLVPMLDKDIVDGTKGEVEKPGLMFRASDMEPEKGGLFDPQVTGGLNGEHASRMRLPERIPNPVFQRGVLALTGLKEGQLRDILGGKLGLKGREVVDRKVAGAVTGAKAIETALSGVDVGKDMETVRKSLAGLKGPELDREVRKYRYLKALKEAGMNASDAYLTKYVYVLPPSMRPVQILPNGSLIRDSINELYKGTGLLAERLEKIPEGTPEGRKGRVRLALYDSLGSLTGVMDEGRTTQGAEARGALSALAGVGSPKYGWAQSKLLKARQDLSARSTIIPDPDLSIDEIGIPKPIATTIFRPFIVRELTRLGHAPLAAQEMIKKNDPIAMRALDRVMEDRPVIMKRDPVLHKWGVMAFRSKLTAGRAIRIPNMVTGGFGADFDGDDQKAMILLAVPRGLTPTGKCVTKSPSSSWWADRRINLAARFRSQIVGSKGMEFFIVDLADVPHGPEVKTKDHITFYEAAPETYVVGLDERTGLFRLARIAYWSEHRDREVEVVTLRSGRQIFTDDDPRGVYGLDDSLEFVRRRPAEAQGVFVPVAHDVLGACLEDAKEIATDGDRGLHPTVALDERFGYLCGIMVGDGWEVRWHEIGQGAALANIDEGVAEGHRQSLDAVFVDPPHIGVTDREGPGYGPESRRLSVQRPSYGRFMGRLIGHGAREKHLPPMFHRAPLEFRKGLLAGLLDTDGSVSISNAKKKPQQLISYTTTSLRLAYELIYLLRTLGVRGAVTSTRTPKGKSCWIVGLSTVDMHRLGPLPLRHSRKAPRYAAFLGSPPPSEKYSYAQRDIIPTPEWVIQIVSKWVKPGKGSAYCTFYTAHSRGFVSRGVARSTLARYPQMRRDVQLRRWVNLVDNTSVWWDPVLQVEKTGIRETGYDLTVPGYETFMSVDGIVLSNTVSLYAPITNKAVGEARKMFPSNNLLNDATGRPMYTPSNEMSVGLFRLGMFGKETGKKFKTAEEAAAAMAPDNLAPSDVIEVAGKKTTIGRLLVHKTLPEGVRDDRLLYDREYDLDSKAIDTYLTQVAKKNQSEYATTAHKLMRLGAASVYDQMFSIGLEDLKTDKVVREKYFKLARDKVSKILASKDPKAEEQALATWVEAGRGMMAEHEAKARVNPSNLYLLTKAGVKPSPVQYQQMTLAPVIMTDVQGNPVLEPVGQSYSEGLDSTGFWLSAIGARTGLISRGVQVRQPGYLNKQMANTVGNAVVVSDEMPSEGIAMDTDHPDVVDRYLVEPVKTNKLDLPKGTLLTSDILDRVKNARVKKVVVGSPLTSPHGDGLSSKSYGLMPDGRQPEVGDNLGVLAGQSIGERLSQLMLKSTHLGGIYDPEAAGGALRKFTRIKELLQIPEEIHNPATLAQTDGKVHEVKKDPAGGWDVTVRTAKGQDHEHYVPGTRKLSVEVGKDVRKGRPMTDGNVDLRQLLDIGGLDQVRQQLVNELDDIFRPYGIRRRNIEILARGVTNTAQVEDPGDVPDLVRGQSVSLSVIQELNKKLQGKGKTPATFTPMLTGLNSAPLEQEDWIARLNHERVGRSITDAALQGHDADVSGLNPFSSLAWNARFGEGISGKKGAY